jgi:hypothetical protein
MLAYLRKAMKYEGYFRLSNKGTFILFLKKRISVMFLESCPGRRVGKGGGRRVPAPFSRKPRMCNSHSERGVIGSAPTLIYFASQGLDIAGLAIKNAGARRLSSWGGGAQRIPTLPELERGAVSRI